MGAAVVFGLPRLRGRPSGPDSRVLAIAGCGQAVGRQEGAAHAEHGGSAAGAEAHDHAFVALLPICLTCKTAQACSSDLAGAPCSRQRWTTRLATTVSTASCMPPNKRSRQPCAPAVAPPRLAPASLCCLQASKTAAGHTVVMPVRKSSAVAPPRASRACRRRRCRRRLPST